MISLISAQLWSLSGSQVARALKKTDRKRVAAREEEQLEIGARVAQHVRLGEREIKKKSHGERTAEKEELMKESEIEEEDNMPTCCAKIHWQ